MTRRPSPWPLLLLLAKCGGGAPVCPSDLPPGCPSAAPSFTADVAPLLQASCVHCHSAGGAAAEHPLTGYAEVAAQRSAVLNQVYGCRMPPADAHPLSAHDRQVLLQWLVCQAPRN